MSIFLHLCSWDQGSLIYKKKPLQRMKGPDFTALNKLKPVNSSS